jgi:hypothetical protein
MHRPRHAGHAAQSAAALSIWVLTVAAARLAGLAVMAEDARAAIFFPPLAVRFDPRLSWTITFSAAAALLLVALAPPVARMVTWPTLLLLGFLAAAGWAISLALVDGRAGVTGDANYLRDVGMVGAPIPFLRGFVSHIAHYSQHVRAHPPGFVLLLWALQKLGLGGSGWEGALVIAGGAGSVPAVLIVLRETVGETLARKAAPFLAIAPIALWIATSADAFYLGVTAWAVALMVLATGQRGARSTLLALGGGALFGTALFFSYGVTLVALVPLAVVTARRRADVLVPAALGLVVVVATFAAAGFWWVDGLQASLAQYRASAARYRPQASFLLINVGAFALALGPATAVGVARTRDRGLWLLVGAGLLAAALADLSGLAKGEVERIWLPFAPWILVSAASLDGDEAGGRPWLALQAAACLVLQLSTRGP